MAGKGGGAWKVAYADFVTAMMAFFLVMWITAQSNSMKQAIAKYFQHPYDAAGVRVPVFSKSSSGASLVPLHSSMDGASPKGDNKGKSPRGGGMITDSQQPPDANAPKTGGMRRRTGFMLRDDEQTGVGNILLFGESSEELDTHAKQQLDELIPVFLGKRNKIEIRGHTASIAPTANSPDGAAQTSAPAAADNWRISYNRCKAVLTYLENHGVEARRIRLSQAGSFEPSAFDDQKGVNPSARVEVYMLPEYVDDYLDSRQPAKQDEEPEK